MSLKGEGSRVFGLESRKESLCFWVIQSHLFWGIYILIRGYVSLGSHKPIAIVVKSITLSIIISIGNECTVVLHIVSCSRSRFSKGGSVNNVSADKGGNQKS